jgi:hypothetical protein
VLAADYLIKDIKGEPVPFHDWINKATVINKDNLQEILDETKRWEEEGKAALDKALKGGK